MVEDYPISKYFWYSEVIESQIAIRNKIKNIPSKEYLANAKNVAEIILDPVREALGPFSPNSWFRSRELNFFIGGAYGSQHLTCEAVDIKHHSVSTYRLAEIIHQICPTYDQLILEFYNPKDPNSGWVHVSCKRDTSRNRKQALIFNGKKYSPLVFK